MSKQWCHSKCKGVGGSNLYTFSTKDRAVGSACATAGFIKGAYTRCGGFNG